MSEIIFDTLSILDTYHDFGEYEFFRDQLRVSFLMYISKIINRKLFTESFNTYGSYRQLYKIIFHNESYYEDIKNIKKTIVDCLIETKCDDKYSLEAIQNRILEQMSLVFNLVVDTSEKIEYCLNLRKSVC